MNISRMITRPCTLVVRSGGTADQYGDYAPTETSIATVCELQAIPRFTSVRETEDGNVGTDLYKIYLPGDIVPDHADAVLIDGDTYELTGPSNTRRNPRTGESVFTEAYVRRMQ